MEAGIYTVLNISFYVNILSSITQIIITVTPTNRTCFVSIHRLSQLNPELSAFLNQLIYSLFVSVLLFIITYYKLFTVYSHPPYRTPSQLCYTAHSSARATPAWLPSTTHAPATRSPRKSSSIVELLNQVRRGSGTYGRKRRRRSLK